MISHGVSFCIGLLSGLAANYISERLRPSIDLKISKALTDTKNWSRNSESDFYYYNLNPDLKICTGRKIGSPAHRFSKFPDRDHDSVETIVVKHKDQDVYSWNFLYLDGARYIVPAPDFEYSTEEALEESGYDFYDLNATYVNVYKIIGFNAYSDLEESKADLLGLEKLAAQLDIIIKN